MSSRAVKRANKATPSDIGRSISPSVTVDGSSFFHQVSTGPGLSVAEREAVWQIFEDNMKGLYMDSAFGWDPPAKRAELFHFLSRYILVRGPSAGCDSSAENVKSALPLAAYVSFRFEPEAGQDVIYCYELQVSRAAQRHGLGKHLMQQVYNVGQRWRMQKVMLTVLKANVAANRFYESQGFVIDPTSPGYAERVEVIQTDGEPDEGENSTSCGETAGIDGDDSWEDEDEADECDYHILSKAMREP
ncbi:hypothetical protein GLOTRDRAFT_135380 [Gloeophyllum trabeum ATCC 11539]|uniref:N-alpha-acetyltransferase 40 n=1 Tax=Gloeophyllum trabeum (strain ATCC 11539 / FP-39264 / Madison 617) TaxID=670483 RepID=S7QMQ6_GLOTA|nr:uncharacterized protein GLOTRDRAFT_135380 [Gloeophyllum trabeum ATCC 11539]EPQ60753.1 hypothetical protein GLOTRDRAFT_135380 [Gloeophyllum trabeum ATCC 11539]